MITDATLQKALRVRQAVAEYFEKHPLEQTIQARQLMPWLIGKEIFNADSQEGKPIRQLLRDLSKEKMLHLIPQARSEIKKRNINWYFDHSTPMQDNAVTSQWSSVAAGSSQTRKRSDSDETYIIDLCDAILGSKALRQHRFDFLQGDPGRAGKRASLPVDAWYPQLRLVVEYREKQHTGSVNIMDQRMTISGVTRAAQRRIYDQRRREVLPKHGIMLLEIDYSELQIDSKKRLRRDLHTDRTIIAKKIEAIIKC